MRTQPVVIAVIRRGNKYLLTRRVDLEADEKKFGPYVWNLPGGGIQFGETPEEALIREMKEEIGVDIEIKSLLPKLFSETRARWQGIFLCYMCVIKDDESKIVLNEEADQFGWFTTDEVMKLKILPLADIICKEADKINNQ
jgi:8-oxo-dGTP diphosphatase